MTNERRAAVEEDASGIAMIFRTAICAHPQEEQLEFVESILADLTEWRDDLAHQAASLHHRHNES